MGFYPKHLKVRRERWRQRVFAIAALSGAVIMKRMVWSTPTGRVVTDHYGGLAKRVPVYNLHYDDGQVSKYFDSRYDAAVNYLLFWFDKQGMYPWRSR